MKLDVAHIAKLANLPLTQDEQKKFEKQLEETLTIIGSLQEVDTNHVQPTAHVTGLENVTREDIPTASLEQKLALANARSSHDGFFKVNAILDNE